MARNTARIDRELEALYAEMPTIQCRGRCFDSCGPIGMSNRERVRAEAALGGPVTALHTLDASCSALVTGRCSIYAQRPLICRLWGCVENMPCLWGCVPSRMLTIAEGNEFLRRSLKIGGEAGARDEVLEAWHWARNDG